MQKIEPWLVGGVKVAGGLDLISAFVKGLPFSEDFDLVIGIERPCMPMFGTCERKRKGYRRREHM